MEVRFCIFAARSKFDDEINWRVAELENMREANFCRDGRRIIAPHDFSL